MKNNINLLQIGNQNKLFIVGAGRYGEILGLYFNKYQIPWEGYIDKRNIKYKINQKKVYTYDDLDVDKGYYIISSYFYQNEILKELEEKGICSKRIIKFDNQKNFYEIYDDLINCKKYTNKVKKFYKLHYKKRCFIIGNGPSLRVSDLEKIKDEITFASNSIYALYKHTSWRPTYYCAWDPLFCREMMCDIKNIMVLLDGCKAAFTSIIGDAIQYRNNAIIDKLYYMKTLNENDEDGLPCFSLDCSEQVYTSGSITYGMLQLAIYMGIEEIYLLGMDLSYFSKDNNKFNHMEVIEEEEKKFYKPISERYGISYVTNVGLQLSAYQSAKKYADLHGIKICNATRGGKLELFERVDFDSLFD